MVTTPTVLSTDGAAKHRRHLVCFVGVMALAMVVSSGPAFGSARTVPTPICPSATANGRFVRQIYLQILGRCPGSAAGSYWTGRVDRGLSRPAFAEAIDVSTENMGKNNVDPVFQSFLSRPPTSSERTFWVDNVRTRHGDAVIRATLASSAEHYAQIGGANAAAKDQAWLTEAYEFILDRAPDPHGAAYFTRQLGAGGSTVATRLKVALKMEFTSENAQGWIGGVYSVALNRGPDAGGLAYWSNWLLGRGQFQTFRMWTRVLSSGEGFALAQTQPNPGGGNSVR